MAFKPSLKFAFAAGLAILWSSTAFAGDSNPVAKPIQNDTGKRICRVETPTGSRFAVRVCRTAAEWQKDADDAQRHLDEANRTGRDNGCGLQCPQ